MKSGKIWGENILVFNHNNIQINQIYIKKGGRCSRHRHNHKNNIFFVQSGRLLIEQWTPEGIVDSTILTNEEKMEISSQVTHRFTALEDTTALEIYYLDIEEDDIIRDDVGTVIEIDNNI